MKPARSLYELEQERVVPWGDAGIFSAHVARYEFAIPYVAGKSVLDVGCGEGYGPTLLAQHARYVVGVDYSPVAVRHATERYGGENLRFKLGDAAALDDRLGRFDVVTCFEVIEHISDTDAVVAGVARLLKPSGTALISTPNAAVERLIEAVGCVDHYDYHVNPLLPRELRRVARRHFRLVNLYGQSARGNRLYKFLKTLDIFNARHRLVRSLNAQSAIARSVMGQEAHRLSASYEFSRVLVRQSPIVVVVARRPSRGG